MSKVNKKILSIIISFSLFLGCFSLASIEVGASEEDNDYSLYQYDQTETTISFSWKAKDNALNYYIGIGSTWEEAGDNADKKQIKVDNNTLTYTLENLEPETYYCIFVKYDTEYSEYNWAGYDTIFTSFNTIKNLSYWEEDNYFEIDWDSICENSKYELIVTDVNGKETKEIAEKNYFIFNKNKITKYSLSNIKVRGIYKNNSGKEFYTDYSELWVIPKLQLKNCYINGFLSTYYFNIEFFKIKGFDDYKIKFYDVKKNKFKKVKITKSINKIIKSKFKISKKSYNYGLFKFKIIASKELSNGEVIRKEFLLNYS